jgi:hypothetical protein
MNVNAFEGPVEETFVFALNLFQPENSGFKGRDLLFESVVFLFNEVMSFLFIQIPSPNIIIIWLMMP